MVDPYDTIRELHGYRKQGVAYGYNKVKGLNAILATIPSDSCAPVIAGAGLRRGNVRSGDHAAWHAARVIALVRKVRPGVRILGRADSAFCTWETIQGFRTAGCWFSVTIPAWPTVASAIARIDEQAWTPIQYPHAVWEEEAGQWISDAQVAETPRASSEPVPTQFSAGSSNRFPAQHTVSSRQGPNTPLSGNPSPDGWRYRAQ